MAPNSINNSFDLNGKNILITGGAGFLGTYFTDALKSAGANVIVADITDNADIQMDVSDKESIAKGFKQTIKKHSQIDVVINNAAIDAKFDPSSNKNDAFFENYPEELISQSLDVNLRGYVLVAQEAVKHMLETGKGNIINVSSIYGITGPDQRIYPEGTQKPVDYAITKGGVVMLTKYLATTYGSKNIRANTLSLGGVLKNHDKDFQKKYGDKTPLGRMAKPEEVAPPLVFLASDASNYMTGANLVIDGGWAAW
jgi:NAD(P)-dependent dehydrogenase (short-subunit alcohol dehydrogenase family)